MIGVRILSGTRAQGMEAIAMQYCAILAFLSIVTVTTVIIIVSLFPFEERQQSDLEHLWVKKPQHFLNPVRVRVRIRESETLVFQKILQTY